MNYLSVLMAGENLKNEELEALNIEIVETNSDGERKLKIPERYLTEYLNLVEDKLKPGFWNEVVGEKEIIFLFKSKDESVNRYHLSTETEKKISELCSQFNGDPLEKTANVYQYISGNSFYRDFMTEHYSNQINR